VVLVDPDEASILAFHRDDKGEYEEQPTGAELSVTICDDCDLVIALDRVFA
jgi:hypothetical protein